MIKITNIIIVFLFFLIGYLILYKRKHRYSIQIFIICFLIMFELFHYKTIISLWKTVNKNKLFPKETGIFFICAGFSTILYILLTNKME